MKNWYLKQFCCDHILTWLLQLNVNAKQISSLPTQFLRQLRKRSFCTFAKGRSCQTCSGGIYTKIRAQRSNTVAQMPLPVIFIALDLESSSDFSPSSVGILQLSSKQTSWDRIIGLIMISEEIILQSLFFHWFSYFSREDRIFENQYSMWMN